MSALTRIAADNQVSSAGRLASSPTHRPASSLSSKRPIDVHDLHVSVANNASSLVTALATTASASSLDRSLLSIIQAGRRAGRSGGHGTTSAPCLAFTAGAPA